MSLEQDYEECWGKREMKEGEKLSPLEEVELNLRNAIKQSELGYNASARQLIKEALEIIERKL